MCISFSIVQRFEYFNVIAVYKLNIIIIVVVLVVATEEERPARTLPDQTHAARGVVQTTDV